MDQVTLIIDRVKMILFGLPAITALGLAVEVNTTTEMETGIQHQYPSVFQELGDLGEEHEICVKPGAVPHSLYIPRHVPLPLCPKALEEFERIESLGVISKVNKPIHPGGLAWLLYQRRM